MSTPINHEDSRGINGNSTCIPGSEALEPGPHDVLLGRGGGCNNHSGNVKFRKLVNEHKMRYLACSKVEKPMVAREVVQVWRTMNPPGRFLARKDESKKGRGSFKDSNNVWLEVEDKKAREKTSHWLRERTPDVLPYIKHLRQQQDQIIKRGVTNFQQQLQMQQIGGEHHGHHYSHHGQHHHGQNYHGNHGHHAHHQNSYSAMGHNHMGGQQQHQHHMNDPYSMEYNMYNSPLAENGYASEYQLMMQQQYGLDSNMMPHSNNMMYGHNSPMMANNRNRVGLELTTK